MTLEMTMAPLTLETRARRAAEIAAEHADEVDRDARFPIEAIEELASNGLLAASLPLELGGEDASMVELSKIATILGEACSATGMIFAMHHGQVLSLARHDDGNRGVSALIEQVATRGALIASATTEIGIGGNSRTSGCAVTEDADGRIHLEKVAPVISYGRHAAAILATARRTADSAPSDQVLVVCPAESTTLEPTGVWDTLGFRGTCSPGFVLTTDVDASHIVSDDYGTISADTMLPVSHILWASVWLGIASSAANTATTVVQKAARKAIGTTPPGAQRLAELLIEVQSFTDIVAAAAARFDDVTPESRGSIGFAMAMNGLKITASEKVVDLVRMALLITGIAGYRNDSPQSLGRVLRDSFGASLMVNNDRILGNNAQLAVMSRRKG